VIDTASEPHAASVTIWFRSLFGAVWRANREILLGAALVVAAGFALQVALPIPALMRDLAFRPSFQYLLLFLWLPLPIAILLGRLAVRDDSNNFLPGVRGWRIAWERFRHGQLSSDRCVGAVLAGCAVSLVINTYGSWKRVIPTVAPFSWDARFAKLDLVLHGGSHPWEWLHPVVGRPLITSALDTLYFMWLPVFGVVLAWQAWSGRTQLRARFFLSVFFVWVVIGGGLATMFSSAGPSFYGYLIPGADPYAVLLSYLDSVADADFNTRTMQHALWQAYSTNSASPYMGISAMPSVHVGMPVLYALVGWSYSKVLGTLLALYAVGVLIATVHLSWHYAIDGYVSAILVIAWWWVLGRWRRFRGSGV
jgi:hypothetical protein